MTFSKSPKLIARTMDSCIWFCFGEEKMVIMSTSKWEIHKQTRKWIRKSVPWIIICIDWWFIKPLRFTFWDVDNWSINTSSICTWRLKPYDSYIFDWIKPSSILKSTSIYGTQSLMFVILPSSFSGSPHHASILTRYGDIHSRIWSSRFVHHIYMQSNIGWN